MEHRPAKNPHISFRKHTDLSLSVDSCNTNKNELNCSVFRHEYTTRSKHSGIKILIIKRGEREELETQINCISLAHVRLIIPSEHNTQQNSSFQPGGNPHHVTVHILVSLTSDVMILHQTESHCCARHTTPQSAPCQS